MSKRRLLVTGARGFVGGTLIRAAASPLWNDKFETIDFIDPQTAGAADLRDAEAVNRAIAAARPDAVVHLAAIAAPRQAKDEPQTAWQVNLIGTFNLAQSVLRHAPAARFIFAGSSEAYGAAFNRSTAPLSEDAPLEPVSPYGATKAAADIMLRQMASDGLRATVFRPFNHTGPGQLPSYVVPAFASQVARIEAGLQEPVLLVGNLEARRDFLDVRDIVEAYLKAADQDNLAAGETFNLSTRAPVQIADILALLTGMAQVQVTVKIDPDRYFPNNIPVMSGNPEKAEKLLRWSPVIPLTKTITDILNTARLKQSV